jgi:hypothetical protein
MMELRGKHMGPANLENLQTPSLENFLWKNFKTATKIVDGKMQKSVHLISNCLVPIIKALDHVRDTKNLSHDTMKDFLAMPII